MESTLNPKTQKILNEMLNRSFLYKTKQVKVLAWKQNGTKVQIVTDKAWIEPAYDDLNEVLNEMLPVETGEQEGQDTRTKLVLINQTTSAAGTMKELKDILMDNIRKVQENRDYIPVAKEVKDQVDTMINIAKTEIEMLKLLKD